MDHSDDTTTEPRVGRRLRKFLNLEEAQLFYEEIQSESGDTTDEDISDNEYDDDVNDPLYRMNTSQPEGMEREIFADTDIDDSIMETASPGTSSQGETSKKRAQSWKKKEQEQRPLSFDKPQGPVASEFTACKYPGDYFLKFFDDKVMDDIIFQSNLYITQHQRRTSAITRTDMYGFLGINVLMGCHVLPSWKHYWDGDPDLGVPYVSSVMTRDRFGDMLSSLRCNDNSQGRGHLLTNFIKSGH